MDKIKYYMERCYPYVIALLLTVSIWHLQINVIYDENLNEMLYGTLTTDSIVLGFLGALIPVVISMRKESKLAEYVFKNDKKNLFMKYIIATIKHGLLSIVFTLVLYVRESIEFKNAKELLPFIWIYITISFFVLTYRCMSYMLIILFAKEKDNNANFVIEDSEEIKEFEEEHRRKY